MISAPKFRTALLNWYRGNRRDLPWRRTADPYRIWVSEIMLQQTRVAAVIPYYQRFLLQFPSVESLAKANEEDVLKAWAGLGYYSRARNLQKAARQMVSLGGFPTTYEGIRKLAGVGNYTAAAVASIAFGLPYPVMDGNVTRVLARLSNDKGSIASAKTKARLHDLATALLAPKDAGTFNQAMMELGATICLPKQPKCEVCPVRGMCMALRAGTQKELPVKNPRPRMAVIERSVLIIARKGNLLLWQRPAESAKLQNFWELPEPEQLPSARIQPQIGQFRHSIVNHSYRFSVFPAAIGRIPSGFRWISLEDTADLALSTTARKALACWTSHRETTSPPPAGFDT